LPALLSTTKPWCTVPIIRDGETRPLADGSNDQCEHAAAKSVERPLRIMPGPD
jgi:hypothetical protein